MRGRIGKYADAVSKGARVVPLIIETTGSISPHSLKYISYLARRSRGKQARDGTKYGRSRASATSFFVHHTQRLSKAAACGDIDGIHDSVRGLKQRMAAGSAARAA